MMEHDLLTPIQTHSTLWDPKSLSVPLNISLDACFVPKSTGGVRLDTAHVVVLDNFISEDERRELLDIITHPGWDHSRGPPPDKWEKATSDAADQPRTWGLQGGVLQQLSCSRARAKLEVQSRLAKMYPEATWYHQPSAAIQQHQHQHQHQQQQQQQQQQRRQQQHQQHLGACVSAGPMAQNPQVGGGNGGNQDSAAISTGQAQRTGDWADQSVGNGAPHADASEASCGSRAPEEYSDSEVLEDEGDNRGSFDCCSILANAATHGDKFGWHQDADPMTFPPSPFTSAFGWYANRELGKPLFVSLILYLNDVWPKEWGAETMFLDTPSDTGILVCPKANRAVLMDQDVLHRLSQPSHLAGGQPRYSLVWKLVMLPKSPGQQCSIARSEWGNTTAFGSSAKADAVVRQMARKRKAAEPVE